MSKERLEEIEERVLVDKVYYKCLDGTKGHWGKVYTLSEEDYNYLIERVQVLETTVDFYQSALRDADRRVQELERKIELYREALEFYAEGKHVAYKLDETDDDLVVDYGETAREALGSEENESHLPKRAEVSE